MKFLCDVHISYRIAKHLNSLGYEAIHVNDILDRWNTKDSAISKYADLNNYVVITKDADFRDSFFIHSTPSKLIKINLGNISNNELIDIFTENIHSIANLNEKKKFLLEVGKENINIISNI